MSSWEKALCDKHTRIKTNKGWLEVVFLYQSKRYVMGHQQVRELVYTDRKVKGKCLKQLKNVT